MNYREVNLRIIIQKKSQKKVINLFIQIGFWIEKNNY